MTREEAIYKANHLRKVHPNICIDAEDFWETVIAALEQEPKLMQALEQEKGAYNALVKNIQCADAISRQAVLDEMYKRKADGDAITAGFIKNLPSVKQEPKTGHWEWVQYDGNPSIGNWHCSECGSIVIACVSKEYKGGISYKYCPNCGAKME